MRKITFTATLVVVLLSACVSKKKHLELLSTQALENSNALDKLEQEKSAKEIQLNEANGQINALQLKLSEAKGENNILVSLRNELQSEIRQLKGSIKNISSRSSSAQQSLSADLKAKDNKIAALNGLIQQINQTLDKNTALLGTVAGDLRQSIGEILQDQYSIEADNQQVKLSLLDKVLFKSNSVVKTTKLAPEVLEKFSEVLEKYPLMLVKVIGHTDNKLRRKADIDNWNVGAQKAATVVRILTEEFDMSPSQILLGSKGEFQPKTSNATDAGRLENRRIELVIYPPNQILVDKIKAISKQ